MQNVGQTVISQYSSSPTLLQLIENWNGYLDPSANLDAFYNMMWNLETAQGYGLDCWGRIVGVNRVLQVAASKFLGFEEATNVSADPFNQSPFYSGAPTTSSYPLSDDAFRPLIFAKALANISNGSSQSINQILLLLFPGRGNCYVVDGANMTMEYYFTFALQPFEVSIVQNSGVLPKPAGVSASVVIV